MLLGHLIEDGGVNGRRRDAVHQDAGLRQFLAEGFSEPDHAGLCRRIGRCVGIALLASHRGDIDNPTIIILQHERNDRPADQKCTHQIDSDHLLPIRDRILPTHHIGAGYPGIVNGDFDAFEPIASRRQGAFDR